MSIAATRNGSLNAGRILLAVALMAWIAILAKLFTRELVAPRTLEIAVGVVVLFAPLILIRVSRLPVYLLAAYAALVPFDELLATGIGASLTKVLAILVGVALVLSTISMRRAAPPSRSLVVWALLVAYLGATTFWAIDPVRAVSVFGPFFEYFLLLAAMSVYPISRRDMWLVLSATIGGGIIAAAFGIYAFNSSLNVDTGRLYIGTGYDTFIDSNEFAAGLLMPIALVLMMFLRSHRGLAKLSSLAALGILLSAFAVSGSRGATIGVAALSLYIFWRSKYRGQLIAILFAAVALMVASPIGQRFAQGDVATGDGRTDIWKIGIASLQQYWLQGAGIGNFNLAYGQYFLVTSHQPLEWDRAAHSIFIQSAVEYGVLGFVLAMAVWFFAIRELHYVRGDEQVKDICIALSAGAFGLFTAGFSLDLMIYKYTWLVFALIALMRSMLVTEGIPLSKSSPELSADRKDAAYLPSSAPS